MRALGEGAWWMHFSLPCLALGAGQAPFLRALGWYPTVITCTHLTTLPLRRARGAGATPPTNLICAGAGSCPWQAGAPPSPLPTTTLGHTGHFSRPFYGCSSPASGFDYCSHAPRGNPTGPNSLFVLSSEHARTRAALLHRTRSHAHDPNPSAGCRRLHTCSGPGPSSRACHGQWPLRRRAA